MAERWWDCASDVTLPQVLKANATSHLRKNVFVEFGGRARTFADFDAAVDAVAALLLTRGIEPGDRVLVCLPNCDYYLIVAYAIMRIGAVYVTCGWDYPGREVTYQLEHSGARGLVTTPRRVAEPFVGDLLASTGAALRTVLTVDVDGNEGEVNDAIAAGGSLADIHPPETGDLAMIMYTSGSTARPKGVMWSHGNLYHAALEQAAVSDFRPSDRLLHVFPLHHSGGGVGLQAPMLLVGGTLVMERFSASGFGRQLSERGITVTALNASHVKMIVRKPANEHDAHNTLRVCLFGLPIADADAAEFQRRFRVRLIGRYGLTESLGLGTTVPHNGLWAGPNSCGRPHPGVQLRVVDENGGDLGPEGEGEILLRRVGRHGHCLGYYNDPETTNRVFVDGWIKTGDIGFIGANGHLYWTGRKDFQIKRSGYNISPLEIESLVCDMAGIRQACVVSIPDPVREAAIVVLFEVEDGADVAPDAVIAFCRSNLAPAKVPQFAAEMTPLPLNELGKVSLAHLRRLAVERFGSASEDSDRPSAGSNPR